MKQQDGILIPETQEEWEKIAREADVSIGTPTACLVSHIGDSLSDEQVHHLTRKMGWRTQWAPWWKRVRWAVQRFLRRR